MRQPSAHDAESKRAPQGRASVAVKAPAPSAISGIADALAHPPIRDEMVT
jgi:hypothetical protein